MAIGLGAAILGSAAISGISGSRAARRAASTQAASDAAAIAEQRRQFDIIMGLQRPYHVAGTGALNLLSRLYGLPGAGGGITAPGMGGGAPPVVGSGRGQPNPRRGIGGLIHQVAMRARSNGDDRSLPDGITADHLRDTGAPGSATAPAGTAGGPDMSVFFASPDYQFRQREGAAAIDRSAAARGGALSGNAIRGQTEFASDLASMEFGNFYNRLAAIAGLGQTSANTASSAASATGSNISQLLSSQGTARASGILGQANSIGNAVNSGLNNWLLLQGGYFGGGRGGGTGGYGTPPFNPGY